MRHDANTLRCRGMPEGLGAGTTETLLGLITALNRDGRATVRAVMAESGSKSASTTWGHLKTLRTAGLVTWDDDRAGTLRCTPGLALLLAVKPPGRGSDRRQRSGPATPGPQGPRRVFPVPTGVHLR